LHTNSPYTAPRREAGSNTSPAAPIKFDTATQEAINLHPAPRPPTPRREAASNYPRARHLTRRPAWHPPIISTPRTAAKRANGPIN